ncbi:hypothetical protein ACHAW5_008418 [Stephanodiscus triporus]|uniref:Mitochondrial import inner membrane translocase subunit Tim21 n=1 Tax=Stephanodiscus triporus TaxID=2934178 RepID=A0ABD3PBN3_9STRA
MLAASSAASRHLPRRHRNASVVVDVVAANLRRAGGTTTSLINDRASAAAASSSSSSRRHLSLRRTQTKGRRVPAASGGTASPPSSASSSGASAQQQQQQQQQFRTTDPHSIANEMVSASSSATRTPGTESVAGLTSEQKISNYAMAGGLLAFVSYVFYYSLASVGGENKARSLLFGQPQEKKGGEEGGDAASADGVNPGFEDFLREANEGRTSEEEKAREERRARGDARELVELEESTAARLMREGLGEEEVVAMAGLSNKEEEEEREMARIAGFVDGDTPEDGGVDDFARRRPMWKRVVFFWRRDRCLPFRFIPVGTKNSSIIYENNDGAKYQKYIQ